MSIVIITVTKAKCDIEMNIAGCVTSVASLSSTCKRPPTAAYSSSTSNFLPSAV